MNISNHETNLRNWAYLALTLQQRTPEGLPIANLQNLRTEIVLRDAKHVAFWFSFSFRVATFWQQKTGKRALPVTHQTRARPKALFPKRRELGENGEKDKQTFGALFFRKRFDTEERDD